MKKREVTIIGIGDGGKEALAPFLIKRIAKADILVGGKRHLGFFPDFKGETLAVDKSLAKVVERLNKGNEQKAVVLVSGDPFFFGLGKYLTEKLENARISIFPHLSSLQVAFSKVRLNWDDAKLLSLHSRNIVQLLPAVKEYEKVGMLTDDTNTPPVIANYLLERFGDVFDCFVCENLEGNGEKTTKGNLGKIAKLAFSPLNVVILVRRKPLSFPTTPFVGLDDNEFHQRKPKSGLITKSEVRAITLSKMMVKRDSVVWDVGSGSGSISIEAASFATNGKVYSMEKNVRDFEIIKRNIRKFGMFHCTPVHGMAPDCFPEIPDNPDILVIGGSCGNMEEILREAIRRMPKGGRFVVNVITLENMATAAQALDRLGLSYEYVSLNIARSKPILNLTRLEPLTPIFILYGKK